jgi:hypothetical protein
LSVYRISTLRNCNAEVGKQGGRSSNRKTGRPKSNLARNQSITRAPVTLFSRTVSGHCFRLGNRLSDAAFAEVSHFRPANCQTMNPVVARHSALSNRGGKGYQLATLNRAPIVDLRFHGAKAKLAWLSPCIASGNLRRSYGLSRALLTPRELPLEAFKEQLRHRMNR